MCFRILLVCQTISISKQLCTRQSIIWDIPSTASYQIICHSEKKILYEFCVFRSRFHLRFWCPLVQTEYMIGSFPPTGNQTQSILIVRKCKGQMSSSKQNKYLFFFLLIKQTLFSIDKHVSSYKEKQKQIEQTSNFNTICKRISPKI